MIEALIAGSGLAFAVGTRQQRNVNRIVREFFPKRADLLGPHLSGDGGFRHQRPTPQDPRLEEALRDIHRTRRGKCFHRRNPLGTAQKIPT